MHLISEPSVTLIAYTQFDCPPDKAALWTTDTDNPGAALVEFSGRNCYQSWANPAGRSNQEYIDNLLKQGHLSVLEHGTATFDIEGISRSLTHEFVRHRHFSYSQLSQRFVPEKEGAFVIPPAMIGDPLLLRDLQEALTEIHTWYLSILSSMEQKFAGVEDATARKKMAREAARSVLPNCAETKLVVTGNYRAWRDFLRKRATPHADHEIRRLAVAILQQLKDHVPAIFKDFQIITYGDNDSCAVSYNHES